MYRLTQRYVGWAYVEKKPRIIASFRTRWGAGLYRWWHYRFLAEPMWQASFEFKIEHQVYDTD